MLRVLVSEESLVNYITLFNFALILLLSSTTPTASDLLGLNRIRLQPCSQKASLGKSRRLKKINASDRRTLTQVGKGRASTIEKFKWPLISLSPSSLSLFLYCCPLICPSLPIPVYPVSLIIPTRPIFINTPSWMTVNDISKKVVQEHLYETKRRKAASGITEVHSGRDKLLDDIVLTKKISKSRGWWSGINARIWIKGIKNLGIISETLLYLNCFWVHGQTPQTSVVTL